MAQHKSVFTLTDFSGERSTVSLYNGAITAVSIPGFLTNFGAYRDALDAITLGEIYKEQWIGDATVLSEDLPTSPFAQRELKLLIRYKGNTNEGIYTIEVPTPDLANLTLVGDVVELADGGIMAAYVTAFQTIARTPEDDTETVTVLQAKVVGRKL